MLCLEAGEEQLGNVIESLTPRLGQGPHLDFNHFLEAVKEEMPLHQGQDDREAEEAAADFVDRSG